MKEKTLKFEGKKHKIFYPEDLEDDLKVQVQEIFIDQAYKSGRLKKDAVYVDLGASVGNATRYFYPFAKKIYAVEPNPDIYQALVKNTQGLPKVETFNFAIAHADGFDYLYSSNNNLPQSFWGDNRAVNTSRVEVKTMSTFMKQANIEHIDVLKVDIESSEYLLFPSKSFADVADKIDFIVGEAHFKDNDGFPDVIPMILKDYGFDTKFVELKEPNYYRVFEFFDDKTATRKSWKVPYNTIFVAERKK